MNIRKSIKALEEEFTSYRRAMHENPGTAYEEDFASDLVREKLDEWGISYHHGLAKTGVVATIEGKGNASGKSIGLRADMDALNLIEKNDLPHASKIPGKMHGCGHDGHTAMLLGAAKHLKENPNFDGTVHLIFQPAEEGAKGAETMVKEGLFDKFPCESVYGMHNWPFAPRGTISMRPGLVMAAADFFYIDIIGKGGHAASPHRCVDPIITGTQIISALQTLVSRYSNPLEPVVLSITNFMSGTGANNVIPEDAILSGTLRTFSQELRLELKDRMEHVAKDVASSMGAEIKYKYDFIIDMTINDPAATAFCADVASQVVGKQNVDTNQPQSMGGEDFGAMLLERPGCYVCLGQAEIDTPDSPHNYGLHSSYYDFNDQIIPIGIEYWVQLVETKMPLSAK